MTKRYIFCLMLVSLVGLSSDAAQIGERSAPGANCTGTVAKFNTDSWSDQKLAERFNTCRKLSDSKETQYEVLSQSQRNTYKLENLLVSRHLRKRLKKKNCYTNMSTKEFDQKCAVLWDGQGNGYTDLFEKQMEIDKAKNLNQTRITNRYSNSTGAVQ